ncbi:MAG: hypothetical protein K8S14_07455, partial [Actinomycetia bacterium]|nr:hypothetical protein [Actinomycetes bacterium]
MKKILVITIAMALAAMLTFPAILFAEEGDVNSYIGSRDSGPGGAGQYILGDKESDPADPQTPQPDDTIGDNNEAQIANGDTDNDGDGERDGAGAAGDGDTEIFCIDGDTYLTTAKDAYELTDIDVSDELEGDEAPRDDDDGDGIIYNTDKNRTPSDPPTASDPTDEVINDEKTDGIIDKVEAEAVEILASEATGATSVEDQVAVWAEVGDKNVNLDANTNDAHTNENVDKITEAVEKFATDFIKLTDGTTLEEFLNDEDVNEIDVTVEQDEGIFSGDAGTAIAIMENPLVPTITDEGKNVYWHILGGAFNISFSPDYLLMETSSVSAAVDGSDAGEMTDELDIADGDDIDDDGQEGAYDHYGIATVSYYYYDWDLNEHPEGTMGLSLYAWVDVDGDGLFDIVDIDPEKAADGVDSDGDVVGRFQENHQIVQVEIVDDRGDSDPTNDVTEIKTDGSGNVETAPLPQTDMDIHRIEGGKVVLAKEDIAISEKDEQGN